MQLCWFSVFVGFTVAVLLRKILRKPVHFYQYNEKLIRFVDASSSKIWWVVDFSFDGRLRAVQAYVPSFFGLKGRYYFGKIKDSQVCFPIVADDRSGETIPLSVRRHLAMQYRSFPKIYHHILNSPENKREHARNILTATRKKYCHQSWWRRKLYVLPH